MDMYKKLGIINMSLQYSNVLTLYSVLPFKRYSSTVVNLNRVMDSYTSLDSRQWNTVNLRREQIDNSNFNI